MSIDDTICMLQDKINDLRYMLKATVYDIQPTRIIKHAKQLPPSLVWITKDWWKYVVKRVEEESQ